MARGIVEGLEVRQPLGQALPAVYWDDPFAQDLTAALDTVIAPLYATLDCQEAYFDPWLTPSDFLDWLAGWVGVVLDETLPLPRKRLLISEAVRLYRKRGTNPGLKELISLYTGGEVEIEESGGASWSQTPGGAPPGSEVPDLVVRVRQVKGRGAKSGRIDPDRIAAIVRLSSPAHVPSRVVVES